MPDAALVRAGRHVLDRARRASDELLELEQRCYATHRRAFAAESKRVALLFANLDERKLAAAQWVPTLDRIATPVLRACRDATTALMGAGFDLELASVGDELHHLAPAGVRSATVDAAMLDVAALREAAIATPDLTAGALEVLHDRASAAVAEMFMRSEDRPRLVARVVSLHPGLPRASVGAWPGTVGWMVREVRRQVIDLANSVRIATIEAVNERSRG